MFEIIGFVVVIVLLVAVLTTILVVQLRNNGQLRNGHRNADSAPRVDGEHESDVVSASRDRDAATEADPVPPGQTPADRSLPDAPPAAASAQAAAEAAAIVREAEQRAAKLRADAEAASKESAQTTSRAHTEAAQIKSTAQAEADRLRGEVRAERADLDRRQSRFVEREERLDVERAELDQARAELDEQRAALDQRSAQLDDEHARQVAELERIAGLSVDEAKAELMAGVEADARLAATQLVRDIEREAQADADRTARKIITGAIQRLASDQTAESVVSVLHLPNDEMKGRIIGREGRNVRTFEQITGVNLIIDDTPEAVLLSCFDPVRREIGRVALEALVLDGRIHPQRIEEVVEHSRGEVEQMCQRAGEDAVLEMGITDLHPELVKTLGHLKYRTSYGQNVLAHLVECGHLAAMMAAELGLDVALCRRCAFLHDIGKALTHEVEGSHAIIGADLARRHGENDDVVHAIEAHHNEVEVRTVEAVLTQAADAISGGRPGARRESLESYVKRLERLEGIAHEHDGVDRVFAMQAGREVRVMVVPEQVDDIGASVLAREIAKEIEEELTYPGQIRVTVVRESRATEVAR